MYISTYCNPCLKDNLTYENILGYPSNNIPKNLRTGKKQGSQLYLTKYCCTNDYFLRPFYMLNNV